MLKILFVCTGNICRSPTAEAVLRHRIEARGLQDLIVVDSAGTQNYHVGEVPDLRSVNTAKKRGISMHNISARKLSLDDFYKFDVILGLDHGHVQHLRHIAPADTKATIALFLEYAGMEEQKEVPDPYYGSLHEFEYVLDLIEAGTDALLLKLENKSNVA